MLRPAHPRRSRPGIYGLRPASAIAAKGQAVQQPAPNASLAPRRSGDSARHTTYDLPPRWGTPQFPGCPLGEWEDRVPGGVPVTAPDHHGHEPLLGSRARGIPDRYPVSGHQRINRRETETRTVDRRLRWRRSDPKPGDTRQQPCGCGVGGEEHFLGTTPGTAQGIVYEPFNQSNEGRIRRLRLRRGRHGSQNCHQNEC